MEIKSKPDSYYQDQNARSGTGNNANTLWKDLQLSGIKFNKDWAVLDIGCRTGVTLHNLWKQGCKEVYGVDIGELAQQRWIKSRYPFIKNLICDDIHELDFIDGTFDLITISHALEHLYDPNLVLGKMISSLKDNGMIHSIVPIEPEGDFDKYDPHLVRFDSHEDHLKFYTDSGLVKIFAEKRHGNSIIIVKRII